MATSSFFYGGSTAPEQNTVDELIDALNQKVSAADQDRVAAEQARDRAETAASNAELSESNVAGLAQQAQETLADANEAVVAANAAVATTNTNAATATTKAAEAASSATAADASADAALVSENAAAVSATNAATSASTASTQASAASTSATNAASSASSAAGSATTATTQATNASNSATAAAGSASAASTSATNAASSASSASASASAAASSASSASASATSASGSASTATTKASEAAASATAAATSASNAATSATSASGSASTATTQATNASNSATAAASSASSASTSATNAANSATAAGTSATNAASSATAASGSASAASASATAAQAAQTAAEAAFDSFDDRYLGAKAVAPTVDNDGNALLTGALYFNSTANQMYAWSGSTWVAAGSTGSGDVVGPASSTDNAIARFDGATGKLVQNSTATVSDTGDAVFKSVNFNDPVHGSRTLSMSSGRLVVDGDFDTVGTYRFGNGWCSLSGGNADGVTLAQLSNGTGNFVLQPNSTGIVEARSGTNPIRFRVYNTFTDASNYERGFFRWNTNVLEIGAEAAGTGTARTTRLGVVGTTGAVSVNTTGIALTQPDGASEVYYRNDGFWPATNLNLGLSTARWGTLFTNQANLAGNLTLNAGTANGVAYLNGSKVLTTGSALTFDGTKLAVLSSSAAVLESVKSTSTTNQSVQLQILNDNDTPLNIGVWGSSAGAFGILGASTPFISTNASTLNFANTNASGNIVWGIGSSAAEQMRLTSTGLGIGTSSPVSKLDVAETATIKRITSGNNMDLNFYNGSGSGTTGNVARIRCDGDGVSNDYGALSFWTGRINAAAITEKMRLDSVGNLGLGVTPSAWSYTSLAVGFGGSAISSDAVDKVQLGANFYRGSGADRFAGTGRATLYQQSAGAHNWLTSTGSGTAGNAISFTQAMTLDASGNLGVGTTSPGSFGAGYITSQVTGTSGGGIFRATSTSVDMRFQADEPGAAGLINVASNHPLVLRTNATERARIDSSGQMWTTNGAGSVSRAFDCRAWVNFNGTGTVAIRASGNVSSITDNGTGDYTVNFTTAMPDANYALVATVRGQNDTDNNSTIAGSGVLTTTTAKVHTKNGTNAAVDSSAVNVAIFR